MLTFAKLGNWDAVLDSDHSRLQILQKQTDKCMEGVNQLSRKNLISEILDLDIKITELASNGRKLAMDEEIHQQAQVAAQKSYKQALASDTGL